MKIFTKFNLFLSFLLGTLIVFSFPSCKRNRDPEIGFEQYDEISSLQHPDIDYTLSGIPEQSAHTQNIAHSVPPKIKVPEDLPIIQTLNMNIDTDDADEQVILVKENNDINARFKILIADYIQVFEYYVLSSEHLTQATNIQSLQVFLMDVDNDKNLELVCMGYNKDDGQTIDLFKYNPATLISGLKYENILSIASTGSLEIKQDPQTMEVTIERQQEINPDSDFIVKEIFTWNSTPDVNHTMGSFKVSSYQQLKKVKVNDIQLRKIIQSNDVKVKQEFLNGTWQFQNESKIKTYLVFNFEDNKFAIYTDANSVDGESNADVYIYEKYRKLLYNRFRIEGTSGIHDFKFVKIVITYVTMNSIRVDVYDNDSPVAKSKVNTSRSGIYNRIDEKGLKTLTESRKTKFEKPKLNGIYIQRPGKQFIFDEPFFRVKTENNLIEKGGYAIYDVDVPVMEMHIFDDNGIVKEKLCYKFDYEENHTGRKKFKTITLTPGKITLNGFRKIDGDPIQLQNEEWTAE